MSSSFRRRPVSASKASTSINHVSAKTTTQSNGVPNISSASTAVLERKGTKPWMGGLTLTSSGLRELDAILGGGQPLETAILVEEDRWTQDLALALARYWCAEAVSQEQLLSLVATQTDLEDDDLDMLDSDTMQVNDFPHQGLSRSDCEAFLQLLPRDLHRDKQDAKNDSPVTSSKPASNKTVLQSMKQEMSQPFAVIEENEDDDFDDAEDTATAQEKLEDGLQNAWQYKLSIQQERSGQLHTNTPSASSNKKVQPKVYCHSYDLSGKMMDQHAVGWLQKNERISIADCACSCPIQFFRKCLSQIQMQLAKHPDGVLRLLLLNAPIRLSAIALPLLLNYIRSNSLPVIIFITVRTWHCTSFSMSQASPLMPSILSLRRTCDASFTCEGFDAFASKPPPEFSDLAGIFSIRKVALQSLHHFCDSTTNRRPPANRYGMKRDRRKVHIRMLHLPPEDFSAGGSSVGSGARSGGGRPKSQQSTSSKNDGNKRTALEPGLSCASHRKPGSKASTSLEF